MPPIAQARYYHRSLNPKKLVDVQFSSRPAHVPASLHSKLYSLPNEVELEGLRPMIEADIVKLKPFVDNYLK